MLSFHALAQGCSYPNFIGTSQARSFSLSEGSDRTMVKLTLKTSVITMRDKPAVGVLIWQRKLG